jgi:hypothetical protein
MLPTLSASSMPVRKPIRYVGALLIVLAQVLVPVIALVVFASPGSAAILQPQTSHHADAPNATCPPGGQCFADVPSGNPFYEFANRLYIQDIVTGYACGGAGEPCDAANRPYYRPGDLVTRQQMSKFVDQARRQPGIYMIAGSDEPLIYAHNPGYNAIRGFSDNNYGLFGGSTNGHGVHGWSSSAWAGYFEGNINVTGNCTGCAGPTRMDHPLDPENKYLYHSTVQSPDMKNVYDGNVTTDEYGEAVVVLPDYFEAFNRDFRYQLTVVGRFAQAIISQQVKNNRFTIKTDKPNVYVSWQVTGIRQDPYANAHRSPVEEDKPTEERGKYLHPTEWGKPESLGVDYDETQR